jgi:hypothetical protein
VSWNIFVDETADISIVPPVALRHSRWFLALRLSDVRFGGGIANKLIVAS